MAHVYVCFYFSMLQCIPIVRLFKHASKYGLVDRVHHTRGKFHNI